MLLTSITPNELSYKSLVIEVDSVFISMSLFLSVSKVSRKSKLLITTNLKSFSKIYGSLLINLNYLYLESFLGLKSNRKYILSILLTYSDLNRLLLSYLFHDESWKFLAQYHKIQPSHWYSKREMLESTIYQTYLQTYRIVHVNHKNFLSVMTPLCE